MAKFPTDKALKDRLVKPHGVTDPSNLKKLKSVLDLTLAFGKAVRDLLPDDAGSQEPLLTRLERLAEEAAKVFERRAGPNQPPKVTRVRAKPDAAQPPPVPPAPGVPISEQ